MHKGKWGTVCDNSFDLKDADVTCKSMGFDRALKTKSFGAGSGKILLDNLKCKGDESNLFNCMHNGIENHDCNHCKDIGVVCQKDRGNLNRRNN